jgi:hypothetical protein
LMERNVPAELGIALLPASWVFAKGSRLRLSIAGADALHYPQVPHGRPPRLEITCGGSRSSTIDLPLRARPDLVLQQRAGASVRAVQDRNTTRKA